MGEVIDIEGVGSFMIYRTCCGTLMAQPLSLCCGATVTYSVCDTCGVKVAGRFDSWPFSYAHKWEEWARSLGVAKPDALYRAAVAAITPSAIDTWAIS